MDAESLQIPSRRSSLSLQTISVISVQKLVSLCYHIITYTDESANDHTSNLILEKGLTAAKTYLKLLRIEGT